MALIRRLFPLMLAAGLQIAPPAVEPGFTSLFNGRDLTGWKIGGPVESFTVQDGAIVANGATSHCYYDGSFRNHSFRNFELKVDVMARPGSNGGVYVLTEFQETGGNVRATGRFPSKGFEIQVNNSHTDRIRTGSLYHVSDILDQSPAKDDEWFTEHIIVKDNTITVKVNDKQVVQWTQPPGWDGGREGLGRRITGPGTIALQGHDPKSTVYYKNIRIKPLDEAPSATASCENLASLTLSNTTITHAQAVEAGAFTPPTPAAGTPPPVAVQAFSTLPAFCRVAATLKPSSDSDIKIEVWMPASGWNGKFEAVGNGGWAGTISYPALATALRRGYATASTNTGHSGTGGDASFVLGHPEKLIDFGYRAVHETTVQAKAVVAAFYGNRPGLSYWNGCSTGGKQGLTEAQRFPEDYDGIVAGAPANFWTHLMASGVWIAHATLKDPASYIPPTKYALIHQAVLEACDALDGVKDGVLDDPTRCSFDPKVLQCAGQEAPTCLSAPQVEASRKIYAGPMNPRTRQQIFPGLERGTELGWAAMAGGPKPFPITADHFRYVIFKNPEWDFRELDFDRDVALADQLDNGTLNATDANLTKFTTRGGKLLLYHGWSDQLIAPQNTINYYKSVVAAMGGLARTQDSVRLFMAPGMGHCAGGEGPSSFDMMSEIERWVEQRHVPDRIVASHIRNGKIDRTRPLCPYPQVARYTGTGSTDDAANFVCTMP